MENEPTIVEMDGKPIPLDTRQAMAEADALIVDQDHKVFQTVESLLEALDMQE